MMFLFGNVDFASGLQSSADNVETVWNIAYLSLALSVILGIFVVILLIFFAYKYREGSSAKRKKMSPKAERNLEVIWIGLSIILIVFATGVTIISTNDVNATQTSENVEMTFYVEGNRFSWSFFETNNDKSKNISAQIIGNLVLEVNKKYELIITSGDRDVIHSFFVYDLGIKQDAIPGRTSSVFIEPKTTGLYEIRCAQFCGSGHYAMVGQYIEVV